MKLGMHIMAPEPISTAFLINLSYQSVSMCKSLLLLLGKGSVRCIILFIVRQRFGKHFPAPMNTYNNRRIVGHVCLCIPFSLLGNNSTKTFLRQWRIVEGVVFYAVRVVYFTTSFLGPRLRKASDGIECGLV
jgi:hypothetical protein